MKVYYAHCQAIYNTPQETRDIETLKKLGFEVVNPNSKEHTDIVTKLKENGQNSAVMPYFIDLVVNCNCVAFRALPDGRIPAGVAKEVNTALNFGYPVFELPTGIMRRIISVEETVEYLKEVGQR